MVAILEQAKEGQAPDLLSRSTGSGLFFQVSNALPLFLTWKRPWKLEQVPGDAIPAPVPSCWVPCSILSLQHHCPLKRRPWVSSGVIFHFCSPLRGAVGVRRSIPDIVHLFPWTLSVILFGSHQSTLECSHLFLVSQTSKSNLLTIPEAPLHLLTSCSQSVRFCWVFVCLVLSWSTASPFICKSLSEPFSAHLLGLHLTKTHPFICRLSLEKVREIHLRDWWQEFTV